MRISFAEKKRSSTQAFNLYSENFISMEALTKITGYSPQQIKMTLNKMSDVVDDNKRPRGYQLKVNFPHSSRSHNRYPAKRKQVSSYKPKKFPKKSEVEAPVVQKKDLTTQLDLVIGDVLMLADKLITMKDELETQRETIRKLKEVI